MKLLLDMNLSPKWAEFLCKEGWEVTHWSAVGRANASVTEIVAYAGANEAVVITHDLDFGAILAVTHGGRPSVVQIREDNLSLEQISSQVIAVLRQVQQELERGALVTIEIDRTRMRLLPLQPND